MDSKVIIGLLIIVFGLSMIINQIFKIDFPFFRLIFACLIIYIGFKILLGSFGVKINSDDKNSNVFSNKNITIESISKKESFNVIFGSSSVNLNSATMLENVAHVELNAIFGEMKVVLPKDCKIEFKSNGVFGSINTPQINSNEDFNKTMIIEANSVFGSIKMDYE